MTLANDLEKRQGDWWLERGKWYPTSGNEPFHPHNREVPYGQLKLLQIKLRERQVTVSWDVDACHRKSLASCLDFLTGLDRGTRVTLRFCKQAWARESHGLAAALARIAEISRYRGVDLLAKTRMRQRPLSDLRRGSRSLCQAYEVWCAEASSAALKERDVGSYGLYFAPKGDTLVFEAVGARSECRRVLGDAWWRSAAGTPADSAFADSAYDRRVSTRYWDCLEQNAPLLEDVQAYVDMSAYAVWMPYQRLLLPTGEGVACFTKITENIEIPFLSG